MAAPGQSEAGGGFRQRGWGVREIWLSEEMDTLREGQWEVL